MFAIINSDRPIVENRDDPNDIPDAARRYGSPFWRFMTPLLGIQADRGGFHRDGVTPEIAMIRAYQARLDAAQGVGGPVVTLGDLAADVVEHVREAVEAIRKVRPREKARKWLMSALADGPMLAETVKRLAAEAGIAQRTLRRAFEQGNFQHRKNGDGVSVWSQPRAVGQKKMAAEKG